MHTSVYVLIFVYVYISKNVFTSACILTCMCKCLCMWITMYVFIYLCKYIYVCMHLCTVIFMLIDVGMYKWVHRCLCVWMCMCAYVIHVFQPYMCICVSVCICFMYACSFVCFCLCMLYYDFSLLARLVILDLLTSLLGLYYQTTPSSISRVFWVSKLRFLHLHCKQFIQWTISPTNIKTFYVYCPFINFLGQMSILIVHLFKSYII